MKYAEFEQTFSSSRVGRYSFAMQQDKQKTMLLYRYNIYLSQKLFGIIGMFEVALRNKIDAHYRTYFNQNDWLLQQCLSNGAFYGLRTSHIVQEAYLKLRNRNCYTHDRLISELSFGVWTSFFDRPLFRAGGQNIHQIFSSRPSGTTQRQLNQNLDKIRQIRNRIAHHQPLCFDQNNQKNTQYVQEHYNAIIECTNWLGYENAHIYHGIDHVQQIIHKTDLL